jgi:6-phosphogluconate dehydrogenase
MIQVSMGLIGVGTIGGALALNIAENGNDVALWSLDLLDIDELIASAGPLAHKLTKSDSIKAMVQAMPQPRAIILLVPAGTPVDQTINNLIPLLSSGDTIIDGGNSDFRDTVARSRRVEAAGLAYLETGEEMVDMIVDQAGQKGTGRWTVIEAIRMEQSASIIEAAVGARVLSSQKLTCQIAAPLLVPAGIDPIAKVSEQDMEAALVTGRVLGYAQGFRIFEAAAGEFEWDLDYARIAEVWRAGCIIRSAMLDDIAMAFRTDLPRGSLILADHFIKVLTQNVVGLRRVVAAAVLQGLPVPALSSALSWFDTIRQALGTTDLIKPSAISSEPIRSSV